MPRAKKSEEINIEDSFKRLEEITALLEKPDTKLKEAMELYTPPHEAASLSQSAFTQPTVGTTQMSFLTPALPPLLL